MDPLFERHNFVYMNKKINYPLIKNNGGEICSGIIAATATSLATGDPIAGLTGFVAGYVGKCAFDISARKIEDFMNPFSKQLDFHTNDFVLMRGYKKDINKQLVTMKFEPTAGVLEAKAEIDKNDKKISDILASTIGIYNDEKYYNQEELNEDEFKFIGDILRKDVLSVGGPIPLDPLRDVMIKKDVLPCNYELEKPLQYSLEETGNRIISKYEIVTNEGEVFEPQWNQLNYGLITRVDKDLIFPESEKGVFLNFSGCQAVGTEGACSLFLNKKSMKNTIEQIRAEVGKKENFQAIVSVPINKQTKMIQKNDIKIESVFKIK